MHTSMSGWESFWLHSDSITFAVAVLLLLMSIASWYVIVTKSLQLWRFGRAGRIAVREFWDTSSLPEGVATLGAGNPFTEIAEAGIRAMRHHTAHKGHLHDQLSVSDWVTLSLRQSIDEAATKLQTGMAILASVASSATFVGLLGTVWGIYHTLVSFSTTSQTTIDKVAGPVGETLIMTAMGLAVAIPANFGYNVLVRGNKAIIGKLNKFGFDLHALFVTGARTSSADTDSESAIKLVSSRSA